MGIKPVPAGVDSSASLGPAAAGGSSSVTSSTSADTGSVFTVDLKELGLGRPASTSSHGLTQMQQAISPRGSDAPRIDLGLDDPSLPLVLSAREKEEILEASRRIFCSMGLLEGNNLVIPSPASEATPPEGVTPSDHSRTIREVRSFVRNLPRREGMVTERADGSTVVNMAAVACHSSGLRHLLRLLRRVDAGNVKGVYETRYRSEGEASAVGLDAGAVNSENQRKTSRAESRRRRVQEESHEKIQQARGKHDASRIEQEEAREAALRQPNSGFASATATTSKH